MQPPSDVRIYLAQQARYAGPRGPWLEHLVEDEGLSYGDAIQALGRWETIPYVDSEQGHMATLLKDKKEVHFAAFRRYRRKGGVTPKRIASFLQPILDAEVFLVTKLSSGEDSRFIEHLGFMPLGVTIDGTRTFILNEIKYPRCNHAANHD